MGWLGWTEAETLDACMTSIELAHEGRMDMLKWTFGSGEEKPPQDDRPKLAPTAKNWNMVFRTLGAKEV